MTFMDLLFKKYASPFLLLDGYIQTGRFSEFVVKFMDIVEEDQMWEVYLHKVFDKTWEQFRSDVHSEIERIQTQKPSNEQIEATIEDSQNILKGFKPKE